MVFKRSETLALIVAVIFGLWGIVGVLVVIAPQITNIFSEFFSSHPYGFIGFFLSVSGLMAAGLIIRDIVVH